MSEQTPEKTTEKTTEPVMSKSTTTTETPLVGNQPAEQPVDPQAAPTPSE